MILKGKIKSKAKKREKGLNDTPILDEKLSYDVVGQFESCMVWLCLVFVIDVN